MPPASASARGGGVDTAATGSVRARRSDVAGASRSGPGMNLGIGTGAGCVCARLRPDGELGKMSSGTMVSCDVPCSSSSSSIE
jgi:hypothetical protein